jgi:peptide/nickel transport system ATP-binding protein
VGATTTSHAIAIEDLRVGYRHTRRGSPGAVVHGVSFVIPKGTTTALVGQSGSGKSTIAHATSGLLPANGVILGGSVKLQGLDVTGFGREQWRGVYGSTLGFVPQDPLSSLDPLLRVGQQIAQSLKVHKTVPKSDIWPKVIEVLGRVGIENPKERALSYPHELSGGQLQRVLIAIAIAARPTILIADEPTSALDVTVQRTILDLVDELRDDLGLAVLLITHDLALAHERSDQLVVLNHGHVKDIGPADEIVDRPTDPYTIRLLSDAPVRQPDRYADRAAAFEPDAPLVVAVSGLTKVFGPVGSPHSVTALDEVSIAVRERSTHAVVGESGSGKTTLARIVSRLTAFDAGEVTVVGRRLPNRPIVNKYAQDLQLVYQNPLAAVDPRYSIERIIEEPLVLAKIDKSERRRRVREIIEKVALPEALLARRARELSGGQRQRVAVARAVVLAPRVLVLDEPTSALDVTVQAQIIDLLIDLQRDHGLSYVFISHDLSLVRQISDEVTVLEHGKVVEHGRTRDLFGDPQHPYTRRLLEAVPGLGRTREAV